MRYTLAVLMMILFPVLMQAVCEHFKAYRAYTSGDFAQASRHLDAVIIDNPSDANALYNKGKVVYAQKNYAQAAAYYGQAAQHAEGALRVQALFDYGNALVQQAKYDEALTTYKKVLEYDPEHEYAKKMIEQLEKKQQKDEQQKQQDQQNNEQQDQQENGDNHDKEEQNKDSSSDNNKDDMKHDDQKSDSSQQPQNKNEGEKQQQSRDKQQQKNNSRERNNNEKKAQQEKDAAQQASSEQQSVGNEPGAVQEPKAKDCKDPLQNLLAQLDHLDESQAKRLVKYSVHGMSERSNDKNW